MHPLWYSPFIPVFFFVSAVVAGLSMVIVECGLSHKFLSAQCERDEPVDLDGITLGLGKAASVVLFAYFFLKLQGVADGQNWALLNTPYGYWYLVEVVGFVLLPCFLYAHGVRTRNVRLVRATAALTVVGIVVNRLNVSIVAMNWRLATPYVPSCMEVMGSLTIITIGILVFRWIVVRMPVLHRHPAYGDTH
jgi:Ni/Fe-hydrogenase subunit HybB-like protein